jgi:hypothetical protein
MNEEDDYAVVALPLARNWAMNCWGERGWGL